MAFIWAVRKEANASGRVLFWNKRTYWNRESMKFNKLPCDSYKAKKHVQLWRQTRQNHNNSRVQLHPALSTNPWHYITNNDTAHMTSYWKVQSLLPRFTVFQRFLISNDIMGMSQSPLHPGLRHTNQHGREETAVPVCATQRGDARRNRVRRARRGMLI